MLRSVVGKAPAPAGAACLVRTWTSAVLAASWALTEGTHLPPHMYMHRRNCPVYDEKSYLWGEDRREQKQVVSIFLLSLLFCRVQVPLGKTVQRELQLNFLLCINEAEVRKTWTVMVQRPPSLGHGKCVGMGLAAHAMAGSQGGCHCCSAFGCSVL